MNRFFSEWRQSSDKTDSRQTRLQLLRQRRQQPLPIAERDDRGHRDRIQKLWQQSGETERS
jgi:hypothetical protein